MAQPPAQSRPPGGRGNLGVSFPRCRSTAFSSTLLVCVLDGGIDDPSDVRWVLLVFLYQGIVRLCLDRLFLTLNRDKLIALHLGSFLGFGTGWWSGTFLRFRPLSPFFRSSSRW